MKRIHQILQEERVVFPVLPGKRQSPKRRLGTTRRPAHRVRYRGKTVYNCRLDCPAPSVLRRRSGRVNSAVLHRLDLQGESALTPQYMSIFLGVRN